MAREGGHREAGVAAGPSPSGPALFCGIAGRAEPCSFKVVATVNLVLERTPWWTSVRLENSTRPLLWRDVCATETRGGRRPALLPSEGRHFLLIVKRALGSIRFKRLLGISFFSDPKSTSWGQPATHCERNPPVRTPRFRRRVTERQASAPANGGTQGWQ